MSSDIESLIKRQDRILRESEDPAIARLLEILGSSYFNLEKQLRSKWPKFNATNQPNLLPEQRKLLLLNELKELLPLMSPEAFGGIQSEFSNLLAIADSNGITLGQELIKISSGGSFVAKTATLPLEQIAIAAESTATRLQATGYKFSNEASQIVGMGITQGWGAEKTARALRSQFGIAKQYAEAEARTSIIQAGNEAARRVYADNGVKFGQWNATLDSRICPYCAARNMRVYRLDQMIVPGHYQCRCRITPWAEKWHDAGLTDDDFAAKFRQGAIAELKGSPNYGVTPFEKKLGLTHPPEAAWSP